MADWTQVAQFQSLDDWRNGAQQVDAANFATGDRGVVAIHLPVAPADWMVAGAQDALQAAGVSLWQPVQSDPDNNRLLIFFESRSPAVLAVALAIIPWVLIAIVVGVLFIVVYKLVQAASDLGSGLGLLLAAGVAMVVLPNLLDSGEKRNPIDTNSLVGLAGISLLGLVGYTAAEQGKLPQPLQNTLHQAFPKAFPVSKSSPGPSGGSSQPNNSNAPAPCQNLNKGNTDLTFEVQPPNPAAQAGAPVSYVGQLVETNFIGWITPLQGETIEFWDPQNCGAGAFASVTTDTDGTYALSRPLGSDELGGYYVYAYYRGKRDLIQGMYDPAITGVWQVVPQ